MLNLKSNKGDKKMKNLEMLLNEVLTIEEGSKLQKIYKEIFIDNCCCETLEDVITMYNNNEFSCENGCICELTYYSQTEEIFKNHFNEVFKLVEECRGNLGMNLDIELTANNLVWFTFEYMVSDYFIPQIEEMIQEQE